MFGAQPSTPAFATPSSTPAFGTPSTPAFGTALFSTPFSQQPQQQQTPSLFQTPQQQQQQQQQQSPFGFATPFNASQQAQATPFNNAPNTNFVNSQLTTQMAPVAPLPFSLADRDIQAIVDAYKEEPGNLKYAFKHLLFSVTEPQYRVKPAGVSDFELPDYVGRSNSKARRHGELQKGTFVAPTCARV